jgi:hypothetical protein
MSCQRLVQTAAGQEQSVASGRYRVGYCSSTNGEIEEMVLLPRHASNEQVLDLVRHWVDVLAAQDYERVYMELGYLLEWNELGAECIRRRVQSYRSPTYYPGIEEFVVTDWRTAQGGNGSPLRTVTWYRPSPHALSGNVAFDLPLNGAWSDLRADFVWFSGDYAEGSYRLALEEIACWEQDQRETDAS